MLKIQTLDRPEGFILGVRLRWLVGHLEKKQMNTPWGWDDQAAGNHCTRVMTWHGAEWRAEGTGLARSVGHVLNLMVSDGIRPHQGATVIRGHLVSTNKPDILLWKRSLQLSEIVQECELHHNGRLSVLGHDFRVLFYFVMQEHNDHSSVRPRLCVSTSFW